MPRSVRVTVPHDSSLFSPIQMHATSACALAMASWAHWTKAHLVPFPALIRDHGVGLVVVGAHLTFVRRHGFFDADELTCELSMRAHDGGRIVAGHFEFEAAGGVFARGFVPCRPVILQDRSLAAHAAILPNSILTRFAADERDDEPMERRMPSVLAPLAGEVATLVHETEALVQRHHCEVADQWSWAQLPALAAEARETALGASESESLWETRGMLLSGVHIELVRPAYVYDRVRIATRAIGRTFVHEMFGTTGERKRLATVVEQFTHEL